MLWRVTRLDPDDVRPAYRQVADQLRMRIESEQVAPGAQLSTHRALADEFGVAVETVKRALALLRDEGLVVARQGKGTFVRRGERAAATNEGTADLTARIDALGRDLAAVKRRVQALEAKDSRSRKT